MELRTISVNGASVALWERAGLEPAIFLCHATGFHGRCWDAITGHIGAQRCIAPDLRGHGRSSKPDPPIPWRNFGNDVADIARQLDLRGAIGAGHSMGGHSLALAASVVPQAFSHLLLLDPVIMPEEAYTSPTEEPHFARKRRNRWPSWQAMVERFRSRSPFDRWNEQVLQNYCEYGLTPAPDGDGFVLACPPEIEGAIYEYSRARESNIYPEIARVQAPVTIVRAARSATGNPGTDMMASLAATDLASRFTHGREIVAEYSHFIPMEAPEYVADLILRLLEPA